MSMMLWTLFAVMTGLAVLAVLLPLARGRSMRMTATDHDAAVYRDQMAEVDRDLERGVITAAEAQAARTEVARRLLAASERAESTKAQAGNGTWRRRAAAVGALVFVPAVTLALYLAVGSPHLPAQPLAARLGAPAEQQDVAMLVRRIEGHLALNPDDGRGWDVLAPVYARLQRPRDAQIAFANAIRLLGSTAERQGGLGEALVGLAGGVVTAEAKQAFRAALAHDPRDPRARFYVARAAAQDGNTAEAVAELNRILADAPPDAPWAAFMRSEIARLSPSLAPPRSGPTADDVAASRDMSPDDRVAMVRGMVARLAERLRENGDDPEGWLRLVRAYAVMGEPARAREAAAEARRALAHRPDAVVAVNALLRELGLDS
jgi:cytochrome c-type biogenesis protein CcmH